MKVSRDGIFVLDKPQGLSSMQAVSRVKRLLKVKKAGHTGTLDPLATGVLPICIGQATRIAQYLLASDKQYRATMLLGVATDTDDSEGEAIETKAVPTLTREDVEHALDAFRGAISQRPPAYSALKVQGKRAYALARQGQEVELAPRQVHVHHITLEDFSPPHLTFSCHVSKGTYIRALIRDLGIALDTVAHMTALRRLQAGDFDLSQALTLEELEEATQNDADLHIITPAQALDALPTLTPPPEQCKYIQNGQIPYQLPPPPVDAATTMPHRVLTPTGALLALLEIQDDAWKLLRVFPNALTT